MLFAKNIFYNSEDTAFYKAWDDISGIRFSENKISRHFEQPPTEGFQTASFGTTKIENIIVPTAGRGINRVGIDSLMKLDKDRLPRITPAPGFSGLDRIRLYEVNAGKNAGAKWFSLPKTSTRTVVKNCRTAEEIYQALSGSDQRLKINLTGKSYNFAKPLLIQQEVEFTSDKNVIEFKSAEPIDVLFLLKNKGNLSLNNLSLSDYALFAKAFVATDTSASPEHFNFKMKYVSVKDLSNVTALFDAAKSTYADSIVIENCQFTNLNNGLLLASEKDNRGYYNAEKLRLAYNTFAGGKGVLLNIYR